MRGALTVLAWMVLLGADNPVPADGTKPDKTKPGETKPEDPIPPPPPPKEVIVTANRRETPAERVGISYEVLAPWRVSPLRTETAVEALRAVPGLHIARTGTGRNGIASLFTRGSNSNHTMILLDGVRMNSDGGAFFSFDQISTDGIDRIEVVRGPTSALYGSDAFAGVVQFFTPRGMGPWRIQTAAEAGTQGRFRERTTLQGGDKRFGFFATVGAFQQLDGHYPHSDIFDETAAWRLDFAPSDRVSFKVFGREIRSKQDVFTNTAGPRFAPLDPDAWRKDHISVLGTEADIWLKEWWDLKVRVSRFEARQESKDKPDALDPWGDSESVSRFRRVSTEIENTFFWGPQTITAGVSAEREDARVRSRYLSSRSDSDTARTNYAFFFQDEIAVTDRFTVTPGFRLEDHGAFGFGHTERISAAYRFPETGTKLRAAYGTGITAPSFSQTTGSFGNPNLLPERSRSFEIGVAQALWKDRVHLHATAFQMDMDDLILFKILSYYPIFEGTFVNAGSARSRGLELSADADLGRGFSTDAGVTFLQTRALKAKEPAAPTFVEGEPLLRRPSVEGFAGLHYKWKDRLRLHLVAHGVGARQDASFVYGRPARETNPGYVRFDFSGEYEIAKGLLLFGRLENLFSKRYEEVLGFPADRRGAAIGIQWTKEF